MIKKSVLIITLVIVMIAGCGGGSTAPDNPRDLSGLEGTWILETYSHGQFVHGSEVIGTFDETDIYYGYSRDEITLSKIDADWITDWEYDGKTLTMEQKHNRIFPGIHVPSGATLSRYMIKIKPGDTLGTVTSYYFDFEIYEPDYADNFFDVIGYGTGTMTKVIE